MPIFRNIRLYTYYTTAYDVQHCKRELCVSGLMYTIWSSIIRVQTNTPEDGHIDARNV